MTKRTISRRVAPIASEAGPDDNSPEEKTLENNEQPAPRNGARRAKTSAKSDPQEESGPSPAQATPAEPRLLQISDLSFQRLHPVTGELVIGVAVDYYVFDGRNLVLSGWLAGNASVVDYLKQLPAALLFCRPDVRDTFAGRAETTTGFLVVLKPVTQGMVEFLGLRIALPERNDHDGMTAHLCGDHNRRLGFLLRALEGDTSLRSAVVRMVPAAPPEFAAARGYLEQVKGVPGHGGLVVGWCFGTPGVSFALADAKGLVHLCDHPARWHRPDIAEAYGGQYGTFANNAGFLFAWHDEVQFGRAVHLLAIEGDEAFSIAASAWDHAPIDPVSFARWSFSIPTLIQRFSERFTRHDGPIIDSLVRNKLAGRKGKSVDIREFGRIPPHAKCSVIVPLYHRYDFMLNQLLAFSEDRYFREAVELVYVVDDPNMIAAVEDEAANLYMSNEVPFRLVSYGDNLGYAGANNIGIAHSSAQDVLLLNSDVIPLEPLWLARMVKELHSSERVGIVGARLTYPNGSVQHEGMEFKWEENWNAFINHHPRIGMDPQHERSVVTQEKAVTGACMLMRRSTYQDLGGLDEGFLIGDFEDSDLCLKALQQGLEIHMVNDVDLIHLERQSLVGVGGNRFRELVTRYNAWRHQARWGNVIAQMMNRSSRAGA